MDKRKLGFDLPDDDFELEDNLFLPKIYSQEDVKEFNDAMSKKIIGVLDTFEKEAHCLISNDNQIFETKLDFEMKNFDPNIKPLKKNDLFQKFDYSRLRNDKFDEFFELQKKQLIKKKQIYPLGVYQENLVIFFI